MWKDFNIPEHMDIDPKRIKAVITRVVAVKSCRYPVKSLREAVDC